MAYKFGELWFAKTGVYGDHFLATILDVKWAKSKTAIYQERFDRSVITTKFGTVMHVDPIDGSHSSYFHILKILESKISLFVEYIGNGWSYMCQILYTIDI